MNREFTTKTTCPLCESELTLYWTSEEIPYFGEVMYLTSQCQCGHRYTDVFSLTEKEPARYEFHAESQSDLNVRVIRSNRGIIKLPELGITIDPGTTSESFISNIEGVLKRVQKVLQMLLRDEEKRERAEELLNQIDEIYKNVKLTVIIDDPTGNSAILSKNTKKTLLMSE